PLPVSPLFPYTTLFRSARLDHWWRAPDQFPGCRMELIGEVPGVVDQHRGAIEGLLPARLLIPESAEGHKHAPLGRLLHRGQHRGDRKSTRLNSSHVEIS